MTSTWCLAKHVFVVSRNLDTFFVWSDLGGGGGGILRQNLKIYSKINSKTNIFSSKLQWNKKQRKKIWMHFSWCLHHFVHKDD